MSNAAPQLPSPPPVAYQPLAPVLAAVVMGIAADRWAPQSIALWLWLSSTALLVWVAMWRTKWRAAIVPLLLAAAALGAARHHVAWQLFSDDDLGLCASEATEPVCLEVVVRGTPRDVAATMYDPMRPVQFGPQTRVPVEVTAVRDGVEWRRASGRALMFVAGGLSSVPGGVDVGDELHVLAALAISPPPANPGEFDFAAHARADGQLCVLRVDSPLCVTPIAYGSSMNPLRALSKLRRRGQEYLARNISSREAPLASAILLGAREELDQQRSEAFLTTGTVHILSISGMHVGILALALFGAFRTGIVGRTAAAGAVALAVVGYTLLTDAEPPAVRAMILVLIACGSMCLGRRPLSGNSLALAALVVLAINPSDLFRVGTQLSFLSVAVLSWMAMRWATRGEVDPLDRLIAASRPWWVKVVWWVGTWFGRALVTGVVISLVTMPLVMANFHLLSPAGIVLNAVLALPVSLAMVAGFLLLTLGWLLPFSAGWIGWFCELNFGLLDAAIHAADRWAGSYYWVPGPEAWWLAGFYALLAALVVCRPLRQRLQQTAIALPGKVARVKSVALALPARWAVAAVAAWCAAGFVPPLLRPATTGKLECAFVSVGHGLAVVLHLPDGTTVLYDAGRLGSPAGATRSVAGYLWSRGLTHLDAVVISHADLDHYNALPQLVRRFSVGKLFVSPVMFESESRSVESLRHAIDEAGIDVQYLSSGQTLSIAGGGRIDVLHPPRRGVLGSDNANSIVLAIEYAGRRVLLTGDLEAPGLQDLLAEEPLPCDVLLAPHHGSLRSDAPGLARWASPRQVVISGTANPSARLVAESYAAAGAEVFNTAQTGAVRITLDDDGLRTRTYRDEQPLLLAHRARNRVPWREAELAER